MPSNDFPCEVISFFPGKPAAQELARYLVESHLAASVHIFQVDSTYLWEGSVHERVEYRFEALTLWGNAERIGQSIRQNHPYKLPHITVTEIHSLHDELADWIREACGE